MQAGSRAAEKLGELLAEVYDLRYAAGLLRWDQSTYMPSGGAESRSRQMATVRRLAHEKFTAPEIGELLEELDAEEPEQDSDEAALVRVTRREYERAVRTPPEFVAELSGHTAASYAAWTRARPEDDFGTMRLYLKRTVELSRRYAEFFSEAEHPADPLIDSSDPGMTVASIRPLFARLRESLVALAGEISGRPQVDDSFLYQEFGGAEQLAFGEEVARRFGYDFGRGRQDLTHHPFMIKLGRGDVRITTRLNGNDLRKPLLSTLHEAGHGMYEQGVRDDFEDTPLFRGTSMGAHESQSRLWENLVGRSRPFWEFFYPRLRETFPAQLGSTSEETFYRALNKVEPSPIRTEADEVTYNLHVIMRFEFELAMLEGDLAVGDLPEAWRERLREDLGIEPPDDRDGVLQDMHWYGGTVGGMFQGYTLGNIMSAQFYDAALAARPQIPDEARAGEFGSLHGWLSENIYHHGGKYTAAELLERTTGGPMRVEPYLDYLNSRYGELYGIHSR